MEENLSKQKQYEQMQIATLWTARQAGQALGYKGGISILRAYRRGELAGYRINARTIRFSPADVQTWLQSARVARTK